MKPTKKQRTRKSSEYSQDPHGREEALTILAGQFLLFSFFAKQQDIEDLRPEIYGYLNSQFDGIDNEYELFWNAITRFLKAFEKRFSWDEQLTDSLQEKARSLVELLFGNDNDGRRALQEWKNVDNWSRFSSIVESSGTHEVSLADLLMEALIPIFAGEPLTQLGLLMSGWLTDSGIGETTLDAIDEVLDQIALSISFGMALSTAAKDDMKLCVLLNLPEPFDEPGLAVKTGMVFKFLSNRYNIQEAFQ